MKEKSEMLVPRGSEAEAAGVLAALDSMTEKQQKELLAFLDGVAFGQRLAETGPAA